NVPRFHGHVGNAARFDVGLRERAEIQPPVEVPEVDGPLSTDLSLGSRQLPLRLRRREEPQERSAIGYEQFLITGDPSSTTTGTGRLVTRRPSVVAGHVASASTGRATARTRTPGAGGRASAHCARR